MNHLGLTVFAGNTPGIILDFDKESKEYTIEFTDGRIVTTSVVNWESSIPAEPEIAKYRSAHLNRDETLIFGDQGWDVVSKVSADYWETGAPHEISHGEDDDEDHMRSDIGGNSDLRHTQKELYNNRKDEEGNPEQNFPDGEEEVIMPSVPDDVERFMERAETAEPDPMKTDREFPSGQYKERTRIPQHSHVREQTAWEEAHYANNLVCEDCGDPLVNGHCYACLDKRDGITPEEYGKEEQETVIREASTKTSFLPALTALAGPLMARMGIGAAAEAGAGAAAGSGTVGTLGRMAGRAMMGQAMTAPFDGDQSASGADTIPAPEYQSIALGTTQPSEGIFAVEINGIDSHPENGGTGNYNAEHGDGPEYLKDVNDAGGPISVIRRFTEEDNIEGALEEAVNILSMGIPAIMEFADSDESGEDHEDIKTLDELLEEVFGEEYSGARDEAKGNKKKESHRIANDLQDTVICRKCNRTAIVGQNACSNVPALPDCPIVSVTRMETAAPGTQQATNQAPAPAPSSTVPQTLNFPVYPKITKTLRVAARKPKMCPYHADLVDYAVALNDPSAALGALSQHLYTGNSCKGGWGEAENTKCRFKPEMIHNEYWDQKERETEERKQQREQQKIEEAAALEEQNLLDPIAEQEVLPEEEIVAETFESETTEPEMTNVGEDTTSPYSDYIPSEAYGESSSAPIDNGSYAAEPVMARTAAEDSRDWLNGDEEEEIGIYEYPGEENYEDGSTQGGIEDTDGSPLEEGEVYRIGPEGELPDVVKIVSVDPQYVEVRRIDSSFPEDDRNKPYRLTLKEIIVQDINIEKVDGQLNPNEIGAGGVDPLDGTPETMNDAGAGQQDTFGTTDLSSGRKSHVGEPFHIQAASKDVKKYIRQLRSNGYEVEQTRSGHYKVMQNGKVVGTISGTPSDNRSILNTQKNIERTVREQQKSQQEQPDMEREANLKTARYDYPMHEQKQFINEGGVARNLDKLDLEGTHYPDEMTEYSDDDYFLFGV